MPLTVIQIAKRLRRQRMRLKPEERDFTILGSDNVTWLAVGAVCEALIELAEMAEEDVEVVSER